MDKPGEKGREVIFMELDKLDIELLEECMALQEEYYALTGMKNEISTESTFRMAVLHWIAWLKEQIKNRREDEGESE